MTAGELVAVGDLAALGDVHPDQLVHTGGQLVAVLTVEGAHLDDRAGLAVRHLERGVAHLARLLAEDRAQQPLLGGQLGLALGRDLPDEDVARVDLGADPHDAALVEVRQDLLGDVRDVARDLLGAQLGVAGVDLVLFDVDRGEDVVLHQTLGEDDRVLVVVALPRHERDQQVAPERELAVVGRRAVGQHRADLDAVARVDQDALVVARALVGAAELRHAVGGGGRVVVRHDDQVGRHLGDHAGLGRGDDVTRVDRRAPLHAGADQRRLGADERHGLPLHVRAHERAVGVVVLEERDERGGDGDHLPRGDVHVVDVLAGDVLDLAALDAHQDAVLGERAVRLERGVRLRDDVAVLVVGRQVVDLVGHLALDHLAVRRLDEPERVDAPVRRQRADEADVRTLRGLDRAHAAVVRRVDVTDLHAGAVTGQTARAQGREAPLVGQARQRVVLVHELRQLAGPEELLDGGDDGTDVDQGLRRDRLDVLGRHPLADHALHPGQARAHLVLDQLADGADAAVAEVVDVVGLDADLDRLTVAHAREGLHVDVEGGEVLDRRDDVGLAQHRVAERRVQAELLVQLVAADLRQVVALRVEVEVLQQRGAGVDRGRLARADLAVQVQQRLVLRLHMVLVEGVDHRGEVLELLTDLRVAHAERLEQHGGVLLALAVDAHADVVALVDLELEPRTTARDDLGRQHVLVGRLVRRALEVDAGRAHELRDDDALGAVDDERAALGHEREVAHEDRLALDLTGRVVDELGRHEQRRSEGEVLLLALLGRVLRRLEAVLAEGERHGAAEVLDRRDLLEDLLEAGGLRDVVTTVLESCSDPRLPPLVAQQPVHALGLQAEKVGDLERLVDLGEGDAAGCGAVRDGVGGRCRRGARGSQEGSFPAVERHAAPPGKARPPAATAGSTRTYVENRLGISEVAGTGQRKALAYSAPRRKSTRSARPPQSRCTVRCTLRRSLLPDPVTHVRARPLGRASDPVVAAAMVAHGTPGREVEHVPRTTKARHPTQG